jgi:hypothetical protein
MNHLIFDRDHPDVDYGRLLDLPSLPDGKLPPAGWREHTGSDFLPPPQHRIVAISCAAAWRHVPAVEPGREGRQRANCWSGSSTASSASRQTWSAGTAADLTCR